MKYVKKIEIKATRVSLSEACEPYKSCIDSPNRVAQVAKSILEGEDQEVFLVFMLDVKNRLLGYQETSRGGIDGCPVDPRVVFRAAIHLGATSIIIAHNHPSGDLNHSEEDANLTKRLQKAGELLGIEILDHVIVAGDQHTSLAVVGIISP
jgi:DNA repair protein RadC